MNSNQEWNDFYKQDEAPAPPPKNQRSKRTWLIAIGCSVALAAVLVVGIVGFGLYWLLGNRDPIASLVPNDTDMYVRVNFLKANSENVDRIVSVFEDISGEGQDQTVTEMLDETLSELDMSLDTDILPWVGTHAGVALQGIDDGSSEPDFIGIIEIKNKAKADQFMQDLIQAVERDGGETFDEVQRGGATLYVQESSYEPLVLARSGNYFYISNSENFVTDSINTSRNGSLARLGAYKKTVAALPGSPFITVFFNGSDLQKFSDSMMNDMLGPSGIMTDDATDNLLGLAMSVSAEDVGLRLDLAIAFDETKLNAFEDSAVTATFAAPSFDRLVPDDTFLFTAVNSSQNLGTILDKENPSFEDANESLQLLEEEANIGILDLLDLLGGEFGVAVGPARDGLLSESTDMRIGISLLASTNNEKDFARWFDNTIDSLSQNIGTDIDSNSITIGDASWQEVVMQDPNSEKVLPALYYRISDQHVILSTSRNNLETAIEQDQTLYNDETYRDTWKAFPRGSNPILYISVEQLADWARKSASSSLDADMTELARNVDRMPVIAMTINPSPKYTRSFSLIVFIE